MAERITKLNRKAAQQRVYRQRHRGRPGPCPDCGRRKEADAMRCRACAKIYRKAHAKTSAYSRYIREYMAEYRAQPPEERSRRRKKGDLARGLAALAERPTERRPCRTRDCMYYGYDHAHCLCGLALAPSEQACPMCIAEQKRIEFKTREEAA